MAVRSLRRVGYKGSWVPPVKPITSSRGQSAIPSWHGRWCGSSPWEPYQRGLYSLPVGLMEKAMAPHSSTLAWKIPWTEEPGGLQSMGSQRVGHNWATSLSFFFFFTSLSLFTFLHWRRKWQPTPMFLSGESQGRGAWWAAVYGVA